MLRKGYKFLFSVMSICARSAQNDILHSFQILYLQLSKNSSNLHFAVVLLFYQNMRCSVPVSHIVISH